MLRNRGRLIAASVLLGTLFLYWGLFGAPTENRLPPPEVLRETQDYYATGITSREFDFNGKLNQVLHAERLDHFPQQAASHLTQPNFISIKNNGLSTQATGDTGLILDDDSRIDLIGSARLIDKGADAQTITVASEFLTYLTEQELVETDKPVTLWSQTMRYDAIGMTADLTKRKLNLKSDVRGTHESNR